MTPGLDHCENVVIVPHIASASLWTRSGMVSASYAIPCPSPLFDALPVYVCMPLVWQSSLLLQEGSSRCDGQSL